MKNNDEFSLLMSKALSGEANEYEKTRLSQSLRNSKGNSLIYNQLKEYWGADVELDQTISDSVQENIYARLNQSKQNTSKQSNLTLFFYRIAIITLLLVSCSVFFYYRNYSVHSFSIVSQEVPVDYVLEDGTRVKLNKYSSLTYTSCFNKKNREVELKGEAFFDVQKNINSPFIVYAQKTETEVLGTRFNILSDEKNHEVVVSLEEGSVRFGAHKCDVTLIPEEAITYQIETSSYDKQIVDLQLNTAWQKGRYIYSDIAFGDLLKKLEHIYKTSISIKDSKITKKKISVSFVIDQPIEEILFVLEDELNFKCNIRSDSTIEIVNR